MSFLTRITFLVFILMGQNCLNEAICGEESDKDTICLGQFSERLNGFTFRLFNELNVAEQNVILSPLSINTSLAMVYGGARGRTEKEMGKVLNFPPNALEFHNDYKQMIDFYEDSTTFKGLSLANSIWLQDGFGIRNEYFIIMKQFYSSEMFIVDFKNQLLHQQIVDSANTWIEKSTNEKIKNILKKTDINQLTRLLLINAITFKDEWKHKFNSRLTKTDSFRVNKNVYKQVPFMNMNSTVNYSENKFIKAIELPYREGSTSMFVILPHENILFTETLQGIDQAMDLSVFEQRKVQLSIPSFKFTYTLEAKKALTQMGMSIIFSNEADFSGISGSDNLKVKDIIHKGYIEVNEEGTEAAAATVVPMILKSAALGKIVTFKADHPFFFIIKDNINNVILFIGYVYDPSAN